MQPDRLSASYLTILNVKEMRAVAQMVGINYRTIVAIRDQKIIPDPATTEKIRRSIQHIVSHRSQYTCKYKKELTKK